jgi:hypothetical protein
MDLFPHSDYPEDQKYSRNILYTHVALKGMQLGAVGGMVLGGLVGLVLRKRIVGSAMMFSNKGAFLGPFLTTAMLYQKMKDSDEMGWNDRAWRLQRNEKQNTIDVFTVLLGLAGYPFRSSGLGISLGISLAVGYRYLKEQLNKDLDINKLVKANSDSKRE